MPFCKMDAPIVVLLLAFLSVFGRCEPSEDCQDVESSGRARLLLDNVGEGDWVDGYKLGDLAEPTKCAFEAPNVDLIRLALLSALCFVEALWFNGTEEDNVETLLGKDVKSTIGRLRCAEPSKMCLISSAGRKGTEMYKPRTGREEIHLVPFCKKTNCFVKGIIQLEKGFDNADDSAGLVKYGSKDDIRRFSWQMLHGEYNDIGDSSFLPVDTISCNGCPVQPMSYCVKVGK
uniref:NTR domain-containing protein n=1 Tax=Steinernema glaseri TaxID=37863 RepID=A0A1I7ZE65_9BILA